MALLAGVMQTKTTLTELTVTLISFILFGFEVPTGTHGLILFNQMMILSVFLFATIVMSPHGY